MWYMMESHHTSFEFTPIQTRLGQARRSGRGRKMVYIVQTHLPTIPFHVKLEMLRTLAEKLLILVAHVIPGILLVLLLLTHGFVMPEFCT